MAIPVLAVGDLWTAAVEDQIANLLNTRIGGRARTNVAQAMTANTVTVANNNGTAAWTSAEDSGGFVSAVGGTSTPLSVPAGQAGLYAVGLGVQVASISTGRAMASILVNGVFGLNRGVFALDTNVGYTMLMPLSVGDTIGFHILTLNANTLNTGAETFMYKVSV